MKIDEALHVGSRWEWHFPCCAVVRRRRLPLPKTDLKGKRDSHACNDLVVVVDVINLAWLEGRDVTRTPIILEFYANLLARANERLGEAHLVQIVWVFITHRLILQGCFPCCLKDIWRPQLHKVVLKHPIWCVDFACLNHHCCPVVPQLKRQICCQITLLDLFYTVWFLSLPNRKKGIERVRVPQADPFKNSSCNILPHQWPSAGGGKGNRLQDSCCQLAFM